VRDNVSPEGDVVDGEHEPPAEEVHDGRDEQEAED
jgi:hypothetical protein